MWINTTDLLGMAFGFFNILRLVSYFPQIVAVARDQNGASAISFSCWTIWIGANGPQLGLPLVGRRADVWHGWGEDYAGKWEVVRRAAEKAGRDPETIVRSTSLSISEPWAEVRRSFDQYRTNGVSYVIVEWPTEGRGRLEEFIEKVMPDLASA